MQVCFDERYEEGGGWGDGWGNEEEEEEEEEKLLRVKRERSSRLRVGGGRRCGAGVGAHRSRLGRMIERRRMGREGGDGEGEATEQENQ